MQQSHSLQQYAKVSKSKLSWQAKAKMVDSLKQNRKSFMGKNNQINKWHGRLIEKNGQYVH